MLAKLQPLNGLLAYRRVVPPTSVGMFLNVPLQQLCALPPGPLFAVKLDFQHRHFAPLVQYLTGMRQLRFTSATVMIAKSVSGCVATFSATYVVNVQTNIDFNRVFSSQNLDKSKNPSHFLYISLELTRSFPGRPKLPAARDSPVDLFLPSDGCCGWLRQILCPGFVIHV
jgi:hypothetical protein